MLWRHLLLAVAVALTSLQISAGEKQRPIPGPRTVGDKVLSDGQELDREMYRERELDLERENTHRGLAAGHFVL